MKRSFVVKFGIGALLALGTPLLVLAADFRGGEQVSVRAGETLADDLYAGGSTVSVMGNVAGDVYAGGSSVLVNGNISQDLVAGGGTITVLGIVGDDVRLGGGTIVIQGSVTGDVLIGGGQVHLAGPRIGGDVLVGGGSVRIDTPVFGEVGVGGGDVYLNAPITGNVEIEADKLTLGSDAVISGTLTYRSPSELVMEEGAQVLGETVYEPRQERDAGNFFAGFVAAAALVQLLMHLVGAFFFVLLFRRFVEAMVSGAYARPLLEIGRGFLLLIALPVVSVLLLVTVIGIPLGILGILGFVGALIFSGLLSPVVLGALLYRALTRGEGYAVNWKSVLIGVGTFYVLGFVPVVGWLVQFGFILLTLGSLLALTRNIVKEWR